MRVSVIVVTHRPGTWLRPCLESVLDQADEVILVDNGSAGSVGAALAAQLGARPVPLPVNAGFAGGVNAGLGAATGDVVALLNDDALAGPGWLAAATTVLADPTVAAVGPKLVLHDRFARVDLADPSHRVPGDGRPLGRMVRAATAGGVDVLDRLVGQVHRVESGIIDGSPARWRWTTGLGPVFVPFPEGAGPPDISIDGRVVPAGWVGDVINNAGSYLSRTLHGGDVGFEAPDDGRFDVAAERFALTGAALVTTAAVLGRLGPLAPEFFAYYEDTDWCWRARLAGFTLRYDPSATVRHVRSATSGGAASPLVSLLTARNRLLCLARNAPLPIAAREIRAVRAGDPPPGLRRSLARRLPTALAARRRLARTRRLAPADVIERWAGVDESWGQPMVRLDR